LAAENVNHTSNTMRQATLDILDADLRGKYNEYKKYPYNDRYKLFRHDIRIDPYIANQKLAEIETFNLNWSEPIKYSEHPDINSIITENGVGIYVFFVQPNRLVLGMPRVPIYVGISGERESSRPLKERLKDYFNLNQIKRRDAVHQALQMYYDEVYFCYCIYDGNSEDLSQIERLLHEFFSPKFAKRDFEPETKQAQKSWNI